MEDRPVDQPHGCWDDNCQESNDTPEDSNMVTDTTEKGLEALITNSLISSGWSPGDPKDYLPVHCVDLSHLSAFLNATQPDTVASLSLETDSTTR